MTTTTQEQPQLFRRSVTFRDAVKMAIRQSSELTPRDKLRLRLAMAVAPDAVEDFLLAKANEQGMSISSIDAQIDLDNLERLLQILLEYLPQILDLIFKLF